MKIEIPVISTSVICPSKETPKDLANYKLSFLDQLQYPVFILLAYFYKATGSLSKSEISSNLKTSLSKTLSLYYPLAGRLVDYRYVNCNDEGVVYEEALANCKLSDVITKPNPQDLDMLFPQNLHDVMDHCLVIKATFFNNCGGMAIGVAFSQKLGDGMSLSLFLNAWAAISRGDALIQSPIFDSATFFPPRSDYGGYKLGFQMIKEDIITKRFIFTKEKINELRDKYTNTTRATRIESLTAFIWGRLMVLRRTKTDPKKIYSIVTAVNIKKRVAPPLDDNLFGNFVQVAMAIPSLGDGGEEDNFDVVEKLREAIGSISGVDLLSKLQEGSHLLNYLSDVETKVSSGEMEPFYFTSICRIIPNEIDFGWGNPVWFGSGSSHLKNKVTLVDMISGGGIEAWLTLDVVDMAKFEGDQEFLAYATI